MHVFLPLHQLYVANTVCTAACALTELCTCAGPGCKGESSGRSLQHVLRSDRLRFCAPEHGVGTDVWDSGHRWERRTDAYHVEQSRRSQSCAHSQAWTLEPYGKELSYIVIHVPREGEGLVWLISYRWVNTHSLFSLPRSDLAPTRRCWRSTVHTKQHGTYVY